MACPPFGVASYVPDGLSFHRCIRGGKDGGAEKNAFGTTMCSDVTQSRGCRAEFAPLAGTGCSLCNGLLSFLPPSLSSPEESTFQEAEK